MRLSPLAVLLVGCFVSQSRGQFVFNFDKDSNRAPQSGLFDPNSFKFIPPSQLQSQPARLPPRAAQAAPLPAQDEQPARRQDFGSNFQSAAQNGFWVDQPSWQSMPQPKPSSQFSQGNFFPPLPQVQATTPAPTPTTPRPLRQQFLSNPIQSNSQNFPAAQPQSWAEQSGPLTFGQSLTITQENEHFTSSFTLPRAVIRLEQPEENEPQPPASAPAARPSQSSRLTQSARQPTQAARQSARPSAQFSSSFSQPAQPSAQFSQAWRQPDPQQPAAPAEPQDNFETSFRQSFLDSFMKQQNGIPRAPLENEFQDQLQRLPQPQVAPRRQQAQFQNLQALQFQAPPPPAQPTTTTTPAPRPQPARQAQAARQVTRQAARRPLSPQPAPRPQPQPQPEDFDYENTDINRLSAGRQNQVATQAPPRAPERRRPNPLPQPTPFEPRSNPPQPRQQAQPRPQAQPQAQPRPQPRPRQQAQPQPQVQRAPARQTTTTTQAPPRAESFRPANLGVFELPADTDDDGIPGTAGTDYPTLEKIPQTSFSCKNQPLNGYYADTETACQVVHLCQAGGVQDSFLCPNGTIFNQEKFSCNWWYETSCADAPSYYQLNDNLYRIPAKKEEETANK